MKKYYIIFNEYGVDYCFTESHEKAQAKCEELAKHGAEILAVIAGEGLQWKPKKVVTKWELSEEEE